MLTEFDRLAVSKLADVASVAGPLLIAWGGCPPGTAHTASTLSALAHLGPMEEQRAIEMLQRGRAINLFAQYGSSWKTAGSQETLLRIGQALEAISFYVSKVHKDETSVQVVLTKPRRPNRLEESLANRGWKAAQVEPTDEAFIRLATVASQRLVVCSPFFDSSGAQWLQRLLGATKPGVERVLVLRYLNEPGHGSYPSGYPALVPWLKSQNVNVFNYALPRPDMKSWESFHAKVVLADDQFAYVGSSNLNAASLDYSMEMGAVLRGRAAGDVATVIRAVLDVAIKWL